MELGEKLSQTEKAGVFVLQDPHSAGFLSHC